MTEKLGDSVVRWRARTTVQRQFPGTELNHAVVAHGLDLIDAIAQFTENVVGVRAQRRGWALNARVAWLGDVGGSDHLYRPVRVQMVGLLNKHFAVC